MGPFLQERNIKHKSQYRRNKKYTLEISISAPFRSNTSEIHPSLPWASEVPKFKHAVMPRVLAFENSKAGTKCTAADASIKARLNWPKFLRLDHLGHLLAVVIPRTGILVIKGANNFGTTPPPKNGKKPPPQKVRVIVWSNFWGLQGTSQVEGWKSTETLKLQERFNKASARVAKSSHSCSDHSEPPSYGFSCKSKGFPMTPTTPRNSRVIWGWWLLTNPLNQASWLVQGPVLTLHWNRSSSLKSHETMLKLSEIQRNMEKLNEFRFAQSTNPSLKLTAKAPKNGPSRKGNSSEPTNRVWHNHLKQP